VYYDLAQKDGLNWYKINYTDGLTNLALESNLLKQGTTTFKNDLYYGMKNNSEVLLLQKALQSNGVYSGPQTGNFYTLTLSAVKKFQRKYGIPTTGYVGPLTRGKLNSL
jgi:peptidoglycan hydrolase-like protein with peptidoglycan-binding domain